MAFDVSLFSFHVLITMQSFRRVCVCRNYSSVGFFNLAAQFLPCRHKLVGFALVVCACLFPIASMRLFLFNRELILRAVRAILCVSFLFISVSMFYVCRASNYSLLCIVNVDVSSFIYGSFEIKHVAKLLNRFCCIYVCFLFLSFLPSSVSITCLGNRI